MSLFAVLLALPGALGTWHSSDPELLAYETGQLHYAGDSVAAATTIPPAQQRLFAHKVKRVHAQVLEEEAHVLGAHTDNCVSNAGEEVAVGVHYHSSDGRPTSSLAFRLKWDPGFFDIVEIDHGVWERHVLLKQCTNGNVLIDKTHGFARYRCVAPAHAGLVIPSEIANVMSLRLRAKRNAVGASTAETSVSIVPDNNAIGQGYSHYATSQPLHLGCVAYTHVQEDEMLKACPVGKFGTARRWHEAGAGAFAATLESAMCTPCPVGKYNSGLFRTALCRECPMGRFASSTGTAWCQECPGGKFSVQTGQTGCEDCPKGTYAPTSTSGGISRCQTCGPGKYTDEERQLDCKDCPDGKYQWVRGQSSCDLGAGCVVGRYHRSRGGAQSHHYYCAACPRGKYQSRANQDGCVACPLGEFQVMHGQNYCQSSACAAGSFFDPTKYGGCAPCPSGRFSTINATTGALSPGSHCTACPPGTFQWMTGQGSCYTSTCRPGTYQFHASRDCVMCRPGRYQSQGGQASCKDCPNGSHSNAGAIECQDLSKNANLLQGLLQMKRDAETPRECSHMQCRLEVHRCTQVQMLAKGKPGSGHWVKDCQSTTLSAQQVLRAKAAGFDAGTWTSIRSYHQTEEARGTSHRCQVDADTGECKCLCWTQFTGAATAHELVR